MSRSNPTILGVAAMMGVAMGPTGHSGYSDYYPTSGRRRKPATYTPDQPRKPRGVDRADKRLARRKAVAWRGGRR